VFAGPYLDRSAHLRQDAGWIENALADPKSRAIPVWNSRNLVEGDKSARAAFIELRDIPTESRNGEALILLGHVGDAHFFAYEIESDTAPVITADARFEDLRWIASRLPQEEAGLLAYAGAMITWRRRHRFCGHCGSKTRSAKGGHLLICGNPSCGIEHFPRLDPAIIVLVSDGDRALLGRQATWPTGRYSTIAGFVEPGESLEDAVAREVAEETGVDVGQIQYFSSQPWPFPSSLMLGFTAQALTRDIFLNDQELEHARWFSRADLAAGALRLPPSPSISYRLIEYWYDAGECGKLADLWTD